MQVGIMTSCMITVTCILIFAITYNLSYRDMIKSLQDRVSAIYYNLEEVIDKEAAGVLYLFTAKPLEDGTLIYVVDGLSPHRSDFRYPGDLIEIEIQDEMRDALKSEVVMPNEIKHTSWGGIFIAYLPIMNGDEVIGTLGVEFDAGHQYATYRFLLLSMTGLIFLFCIIGRTKSI